MLERIRRAAATIRPRAIAQLAARVTRLVSEQETLASRITDQAQAASGRLDTLEQQFERDHRESAAWRARQDARFAEVPALAS